MEIEVSVIVPTYKRPALLKQCLDALLNQKIQVEYEIIVVIDGGEEELKKSVDRSIPASDQLRIIAVGSHGGPAAARNFGFANARGKLIVFTDDDCIPDAGFLNAHWIAYRNANTNLAAFRGRLIVPVSSKPTDYERNVAQLETAEFVTANCSLTREAFVLVGGFDEAYTMAWREDSDLHFKLLNDEVPIVNVPNAIVTHPVRQARWNVSLASEKKNMFNALLYKKFPGMYLERINSRPPVSYYAMVAFMSIGVAMIFILPLMSIALFFCWIVLVTGFSLRRIRHTSKRPMHLIIIFVTSALIPFFSVYWNMYGNMKFRSLLL
jgi:GT2 family glycosyltransferase